MKEGIIQKLLDYSHSNMRKQTLQYPYWAPDITSGDKKGLTLMVKLGFYLGMRMVIHHSLDKDQVDLSQQVPLPALIKSSMGGERERE